MEHGSLAFISHILKSSNLNSRKEELILVTSQFLSFKEFSEKLNSLIYELSKMIKIDNIKELMCFVSKTMKNVFSSERSFLWVSDSVTLYIKCKFNINFFKINKDDWSPLYL